MEAEELMRHKALVSYGSPGPLPYPAKPGIPGPPYPRAEPSAPFQEPLDPWPGAGGSRAGCRDFPTPIPPQTTAFEAEESTLHLSEAEAREALEQFAASKCCYGSAAAEHMEVQSMAALNTYRYKLQSFTESRSTLPASEPYGGGFVDSPAMGVPPGPWDIVVDPPPLFADCEMNLPVPHTYNVQGCPSCLGTGNVPCSMCVGTGWRTCCSCGGSGSYTDENGFCSSCPCCGGSGQIRCSFCLGMGEVPCVRCGTKGLLLYHLELTITWKTSVAEYVADKGQGFPVSRFQKVTGWQLFSEEQPLVTPLNLPPPLVQGARSCLALHQMQVSEETRILRQKHTVEIIPLTKIDYEWKGKGYSFYVFGNERKVYAKDYPSKCCCALL